MNPSYWQKIKEANFGLSGEASRELNTDLKPLLKVIENLNQKGRPLLITKDWFEKICLETLPYATLVDHTTINVGAFRLEKITELALEKGFIPTDYFLPIDQSSGMISIVLGHPQWKLHLAINEGLDGWTEHTLKRIRDFHELLSLLFADKKILPKIDIEEEEDILTGRKESPRLYIRLPGCQEFHAIIINNDYTLSHISEFVIKHGEGIQHYAIDVDYLISPEAPFGHNLEELFHFIKEKNLLPLTSEIMAGEAGRNPDDLHQVKQFFSGEVGYGFFFEFIERMGQNAKRGLFVANTVLGLYQAKEKEKK